MAEPEFEQAKKGMSSIHDLSIAQFWALHKLFVPSSQKIVDSLLFEASTIAISRNILLAHN
jgi:hypothetical protein